VDFSGRRVGVIGTGSTAIQAIPVIAEEAAHLTVFQRTPNYSVPARNGPLTPKFQRYLKENYAEIRQKMRESVNGFDFSIADRSALGVSDEERQALYEEAWERGGLRFRATFKDILLDKTANDTAADFIRAKIRSIVKDPATAAKLSDIDHPYAAKRPPIDTNYFETYNRDNVSLIDVRAVPIERVTPRGLRTRDGEYALDMIVFATGFDAMTGPLLRMNITGRNGYRLKDAWSTGPRTYLGLQVPGFPNLFTITGPGSPSVLCNMPVAIEQHADFITDCIAHMHAHRLFCVEATPDATEKWATQVNEAASVTLLPQAKHSWYLGANIPGKPRVFMPYAGGMARYRAICAGVALSAVVAGSPLSVHAVRDTDRDDRERFVMVVPASPRRSASIVREPGRDACASMAKSQSSQAERTEWGRPKRGSSPRRAPRLWSPTYWATGPRPSLPQFARATEPPSPRQSTSPASPPG
jgi:cation diffusion facilitator CzcD-associated flavoprotein CzcO